jgi:ATP-dependent Clp protease adaptor protein ClpS
MATDVKVDQDIEQMLQDAVDSQKMRRVILFNDEHHSMEEVVAQVKKAVKCSQGDAMRITLMAHNNGQAVCFAGPLPKCVEVQSILQEIDLACDIIE